MTLPTLSGARVVLRPLVRTDAPRLAAIVNDPAVSRTLRATGRVSVAAEEMFIESLATASADLVLGVTAADDGRLLGAAGLHHLDDPARKAELGIFLGPPAEWGHGHGSDAVALLMRHAFEALRLHRVWLHVHADHERAIRVYERLGFRHEGLLRDSARRDDGFVDVVSMGILAGEWAAGRGSG